MYMHMVRNMLRTLEYLYKLQLHMLLTLREKEYR